MVKAVLLCCVLYLSRGSMDTVEERCSVVVDGGCYSYQQPAGTSTCTVRGTGGTRTGAVLCADPTVDAKQPVHDCIRICIFIGEHCGHISSAPRFVSPNMRACGPPLLRRQPEKVARKRTTTDNSTTGVILCIGLYLVPYRYEYRTWYSMGE